MQKSTIIVDSDIGTRFSVNHELMMDRNGAFASSDDAFSAAVYFVCDILLVFRFI